MRRLNRGVGGVKNAARAQRDYRNTPIGTSNRCTENEAKTSLCRKNTEIGETRQCIKRSSSKNYEAQADGNGKQSYST